MKYFVFEHHNFWQRELGDNSMIDAEVVFMWADWPFPEGVRLMHMLGKKVIVYEHGFGSLLDYELNNRPPIADGYLALGNKSKQSLMRVGVPESNILVTGNPVFDDIKKTEHTGNRALFVALHWVRDIAQHNSDTFKRLTEAYRGYDWTVKLIDKSGDVSTDKKKWYNEVDSSDILKDIKEKLPSYDIIFTPRPSTFEAFGRLMGIPVYCVDEFESYKQEGEPNMQPFPNTYLEIGKELTEYNNVSMDEYIQRPSVPLDKILKWVKKL